MLCSKKLFKSNPRLLKFFHEIPLANCQPKLSHPVNNYINDVHGIGMSIQCSGVVGKHKKFFDDGKYGHDLVSRMVYFLFNNVLVIKMFVGNKLTVVFFEVCEHVHQGVVDGFCCLLTDICMIRFLDCGKDMLHKILLDSCHFLTNMHFLGVHDSHVRIHVGGCDNWDDERTWVSCLNEGIG